MKEYNKGLVELKDAKFIKYKEQACDRCKQIAEDLDSIEKTGDVQKPKTTLDNEKSTRTNETNPINSPKSTGTISFPLCLGLPQDSSRVFL